MMGGADVRCRVVQFCNYLITILSHKHHSVASNLNVTNIFTQFLNYIVLKADSGASKHFIREEDERNLVHVHPLLNGPMAKLPNNDYIHTKSGGFLPFSNKLSANAKKALIYPELKNSSLLSVGQLCDNNCIAIKIGN